MALFSVFLITFIVFPGAFLDSSFSMLNGIENEKERESWYSIIIILLFNIFDTAGRFMGGKFHLPGKTVMILAALRTIFVVSTTMVALKSSPEFIFGSDWFKISNMALFAISNGYVST
jgi:hypothetical protein